jgi:hypothetical protein
VLLGHRGYRVKREILEPLVRQERMACKGHREIRGLPDQQGRRVFREYRESPARMGWMA